MNIRFGPAGLGSIETAEKVLEEYSKLGLKACEIAFTYGIYIKNKENAARIGKRARELDISLSIHAPYYVNLNSADSDKRAATKKRILDCCEVGEWLGAKVVVFHPGYYSNDRNESYDNIRDGIIEIIGKIRKRGWKIEIVAETMGKVNVFGSVEEISRLVKETGCSFCIDFAHILAREKEVDFSKVAKLFPSKKWHVHFSGIVYGEKGEKHHRETKPEELKELLENLKKVAKNKEIVIINESPFPVDDSIAGLKIWKRL